MIGASACGASPPEPDAPGSTPSSGEVAPAAPTELTGAAKKLQGTWEIVQYKSVEPIPKEAMPLMSDLFDTLRIRFDGTDQAVVAGKMPEEKNTFSVDGESGDEFKLVSKGGMFDGAQCKFLGADEWEVVDQGPTWPGTSRLRRVK